MISPEWWDHAVVAALIAVLPWRGTWEYRRLAGRVSAGVPDARTRRVPSAHVERAHAGATRIPIQPLMSATTPSFPMSLRRS